MEERSEREGGGDRFTRWLLLLTDGRRRRRGSLQGQDESFPPTNTAQHEHNNDDTYVISAGLQKDGIFLDIFTKKHRGRTNAKIFFSCRNFKVVRTTKKLKSEKVGFVMEAKLLLHEDTKRHKSNFLFDSTFSDSPLDAGTATL